ncbi:hypothetical protein V6N13_092793 [Hibiscus sabdariffa]
MAIVWNDVCANITWSIGNGCNTTFMHDSWLSNVEPLVNHVEPSVPRQLPKILVTTMVDGNGCWLWTTFQDLLSLSLLFRIVVVKCHSSQLLDDKVGGKDMRTISFWLNKLMVPGLCIGSIIY